MNIDKQIKLIKNENIIWYIYFFIVLFALYTNNLEKDYLLTKDKKRKILSQKINTTILIVAFFIYLYFFYLSYNNCKTNKNKINIERLIVSFLFLIAGALAIYADYDNNITNTDIGIL